MLGIRDVARDAGVEARVIVEDEVDSWLEELEKLRSEGICSGMRGFWAAFGCSFLGFCLDPKGFDPFRACFGRW